ILARLQVPPSGLGALNFSGRWPKRLRCGCLPRYAADVVLAACGGCVWLRSSQFTAHVTPGRRRELGGGRGAVRLRSISESLLRARTRNWSSSHLFGMALTVKSQGELAPLSSTRK